MGLGAAGTAAAVGAAGSIGGALINSSAAGNAAATQAASQRQAAQIQQQEFSTDQANLAPFRTTGQSALYSLADLYGLDPAGGTPGNGTIGGGGYNSAASSTLKQFMALSGLGADGNPSATAVPGALQQFANSPIYTFARQQGQAALSAAGAGNGTLVSGAQAQANQKFGQGLAAQQFGTYTTNLQNLYSGLVSGLGNLANVGQNSAATAGQQGIASAGQIGQSIGNVGTANAAGIIGSTNATTGGISNALAQLTGSNSSYGGGGGSGLGGLASSLYNGVTSLGVPGNTGTLNAAGNATDAGGQFLQQTGFYNPLPA